MFKNILVLCSGNICRSPIAEALLREALAADRHVSSAGITALVGYPADPMAVKLCAEAGVDISGHRARQATPELLLASDLILAMSQDHIEWMAHFHPYLKGRTHKLLRWQDNGDVVDPYRQPREVFERAMADIRLGVADWVPRIRRRKP